MVESRLGPVGVTTVSEPWLTVGSDATHPVGVSTAFDLAFGSDGHPVLAYLNRAAGDASFSLKKWSGTAWSVLGGIAFTGVVPDLLSITSDWAGYIVIAVSSLQTGGGSLVNVYQLSGGQLKPLGPDLLPGGQVVGLAVRISAFGPVVAWHANAQIVAQHWDGTKWVQLGTINESPATFNESQSPTLAVLSNGTLAVAYTGESGVEVKIWNGSSWIAVGGSVAPSSYEPTLGSDSTAAPIVALTENAKPNVSRWSGSAWTSLGAPTTAGVFGSLAMATSASGGLLVVSREAAVVTAPQGAAQRALMAHGLSRLSGWTSVGQGSINGTIPLYASDGQRNVVRFSPLGQPWIAWAAAAAQGADPNIVVSTPATPVVKGAP